MKDLHKQFQAQFSILSAIFKTPIRWIRFCKIGVLRNFAKVIGKHLRQSLFFNKIAVLSPATLLKKRPWHRCFMKFVRTPFFYRTPLLAASVLFPKVHVINFFIDFLIFPIVRVSTHLFTPVLSFLVTLHKIQSHLTN